MNDISTLCGQFEEEIDGDTLPLIISYPKSRAKSLLLEKILENKLNLMEVYTHFTKPQRLDLKDNGAKVLSGWGMLLEEYRRSAKERQRLTEREFIMQSIQEILAT